MKRNKISLIDKFMQGNCAIDFTRSSQQSIEILSEQIKYKYPDSGAYEEDWDYPTLLSFWNSFKGDQICIYHVSSQTYDGYVETPVWFELPIHTAEEMIETEPIKQIKESEFMKLFT